MCKSRPHLIVGSLNCDNSDDCVPSTTTMISFSFAPKSGVDILEFSQREGSCISLKNFEYHWILKSSAFSFSPSTRTGKKADCPRQNDAHANSIATWKYWYAVRGIVVLRRLYDELVNTTDERAVSIGVTSPFHSSTASPISSTALTVQSLAARNQAARAFTEDRHAATSRRTC